MPEPKRILVGVCGGIAAYKALDVVSALRKQGHHLQVILTEAATHFVSPASFAAVSGGPARVSMWSDPASAQPDDSFPHLYPSTETELFLLLAATANSLQKLATGAASDLLSTSVLSLPETCMRFFAPAMNVEMWRNPAVQANVHTLEQRDWQRLGPGEGMLACGMKGPGRLLPVEEILSSLDQRLQQSASLTGKTLLLLSGPTREHLDPIRYIGNPSSGKMGKALAEAALARGAEVILVSGPVPEANLPQGSGLTHLPILSAQEMLETAAKHLPHADAILHAAAVADYRPKDMATEKLPKQSQAFQLELVPTPDIAASLAPQKPPACLSLGFALQSGDGTSEARRKLDSKDFDAIVLNDPSSLNASDGSFTLFRKGATEAEVWGRLDKRECAERILHTLFPETPHG